MLFRSVVNGIKGLILFPDVYSHPNDIDLPNNINVEGSGGWTSNQYTDSQWEKMESAGAIFFPLTGKTDEGDVKETESAGYYWASTYSNITISGSTRHYAHRLQINNVQLDNTYHYRYYGCAVRLVRDVD